MSRSLVSYGWRRLPGIRPWRDAETQDSSLGTRRGRSSLATRPWPVSRVCLSGPCLFLGIAMPGVFPDPDVNLTSADASSHIKHSPPIIVKTPVPTFPRSIYSITRHYRACRQVVGDSSAAPPHCREQSYCRRSLHCSRCKGHEARSYRSCT